MTIIKKLLKRDGQLYGALINDNGTEYPIPWMGLLSTDIYEDLKKSGYTLVDAEKAEFTKDGVSIFTLPVLSENWQPADDSEASIFDNFFDMYELVPKAKLFREQVRPITNVERNTNHNYTIKTREEFLKYLNTIGTGIPDSDFLPINYFVAPEARFTLEELATNQTAQFHMYTLERRRQFSWERFKNLRAWLIANYFNGSTNVSATDIKSAYNSWDLDGVFMPYSASDTKMTNMDPMERSLKQMQETDQLSAEQNAALQSRVKYAARFKTYEFMMHGRANGDYVFAEDAPVSEEYKMRPALAEMLDPDKVASLEDDEYLVCKVVVEARRPVTTLTANFTRETSPQIPEEQRPEAGSITITPDRYRVIINHTFDERAKLDDTTKLCIIRDYSGIRLLDPMNESQFLSDTFYTATDKEYTEYCFLTALSKKLISARRIKCTDTSYSILMDAGYTPGAAIMKIANSKGYYRNFTYANDNSLKSFEEEVKDNLYKEEKMPRDMDGTIIEPRPSIDTFDNLFHRLDYIDIINYFKYPNELAHNIDDNLNKPYSIEVPGKGIQTFSFDVYRETKISDIEEIITGIQDLGSISKAKEFEDKTIAEMDIYGEFYMAIHALGFSLEEIEEAVNNYINLENKPDKLRLSRNGMTIVVEVPLLNQAYIAAESEKYQIRSDSIFNAATFYKVFEVVRELSNNPEIHRAVGVAGISCNMWVPKVRRSGDFKVIEIEPTDMVNVIMEMTNQYITHNSSGLVRSAGETDKLEQKAALAARVTVLNTYQLGGKMPAATKDIPEDWLDIKTNHPKWYAAIEANCKLFRDSTMALCDDVYNPVYEGHTTAYFCVNAIVKPTEVIMLGAEIAKETYLRAVYSYDFVSANYDYFLSNHYLSDDIYFKPSFQNAYWEFVDTGMGNGHISNNITLCAVGMDVNAYSDAELYRYVAEDNPGAEMLSMSRFHTLQLYSLKNYYDKAYQWLDENPDKMMPAPMHPAELIYTEAYYRPEYHEVSPVFEGVGRKYRAHTPYMLVGPALDERYCNFPIPILRSKVTNSKRMLASTQEVSITRASFERLLSFSFAEIFYDKDLPVRQFPENTQKLMVTSGGIIDTVKETYIKPEDVMYLESNKYCLIHLDSPTLHETIIKDAFDQLWRVVYENTSA